MDSTTETENFELVRQFVVKRTHAEKPAHESLFREHFYRVTDPAFRAIFVKYYSDSLKIRRFRKGSRQQKLLEAALRDLYFLNFAARSDRAFATQLVNGDTFKRVIENEARRLLIGSGLFSAERPGREATALLRILLCVATLCCICLLVVSSRPALDRLDRWMNNFGHQLYAISAMTLITGAVAWVWFYVKRQIE